MRLSTSITITILTIILLLFTDIKALAKVKVDGKIEPDEYQSVYEVAKELRIFIAKENNNVFVGMESKAKGWVSIGFGSPKMDKAIMFLFTQEKDKFVAKELIGKGHKHDELGKNYINNFSVKKENNKTIVEFVIPEKFEYVTLKGDVDTIWAVSESYSLRSYHSKRGNLKIKF